MSWLDNFFSGSGIKRVAINGTLLPAEVFLNFASGATGNDNPGQTRSDIFIAAVPPPGSNGQLLTVVGGSAAWANAPSGFTAGSDLAGNGTSTSTNQYVSSLSYSSAAAGGDIAINGTATRLVWSATGVPFYTQATPTSDVAVADTVITTQAPFASASTNKSSANCLIKIPAALSGGTHGIFRLHDGSDQLVGLGYSSGTGGGGVWLNAAGYGTLQTNPVLSVDGALHILLNAFGGSIISLSGNTYFSSLSAASLALSTPLGGDNFAAPKPFSFLATSIALTNVNVTLSNAQIACPAIRLTGTLSGNVTITFPNVTGFWTVDTTGLTMSTFTLALASGSATTNLLAADVASTNGLFAVSTSGSNSIAVTCKSAGGGTAAPVTFTRRTNTANSTYTIDSTGGGADYYIIHNKSGAVSYVLPPLTDGRTLKIKDKTGAIQTLSNNIFIVPHGNEKFDNQTPFALSGTAYHFTNGSATVTATGSKFTTELAVGMSIQSSNQSGTNYIVSAIGSDTSLTLAITFTGTTTTTATATLTSLTYSTNAGCLEIFTDATDWYSC